MAEQRYQAVLSVVEDGLEVTEAAGKAGVSRQTLHGWLGRYAAGGLEGLADRSHRPASCPHQMAAEVEVRLVELRGLHPGWGADKLLYRLEREGCDPVPNRAAVSRALVRLGRCTPAERFADGRAGAGPPLDLSALAARRGGDDWVSRRVAGNGIICVAWQQVSAGMHRAGEVVDVHVTPRLLEIWSGNDLVKTVVRTSAGDVRKKRASKPAIPPP